MNFEWRICFQVPFWKTHKTEKNALKRTNPKSTIIFLVKIYFLPMIITFRLLFIYLLRWNWFTERLLSNQLQLTGTFPWVSCLVMHDWLKKLLRHRIVRKTWKCLGEIWNNIFAKIIYKQAPDYISYTNAIWTKVCYVINNLHILKTFFFSSRNEVSSKYCSKRSICVSTCTFVGYSGYIQTWLWKMLYMHYMICFSVVPSVIDFYKYA